MIKNLTYDKEMHRIPNNDNTKHECYDELVELERQLQLKPQKQLRREMRKHLIYNDAPTSYNVANMMFCIRFERNIRHVQACERRRRMHTVYSDEEKQALKKSILGD